MKKISMVIGTRPEAIKMAPLILALRAHPSFICEVCATAQHRSMLDQICAAFDLRLDRDLDLMLPDQSLTAFTARALVALDDYFAESNPDMVLVQGDTTTVFCATWAAFHRHIPVGHVEAGLRTCNLHSPWPEEANRVLTSRLAALHFAPTEQSRMNLLREQVPDASIVVTGNTVIDALFLARDKIGAGVPPIAGLPDPLSDQWPGRSFHGCRQLCAPDLPASLSPQIHQAGHPRSARRRA